ncbi:MAG: hypothetical protein Q7V20_13585 [Aquabacterium sp.]|nr:hypothetical protein [Aquabacterium sp.]MDO9004476.1 hypothetical protein [Aquabacterium sp.]
MAVGVAVAVLWPWPIDDTRPDRWNLIGSTITLIGMAIICSPRGSA